MCLILFSWKTHAKYKLVLAANRDEFYDRPTKPANFWEDYPEVIAGRDEKSGGTWIGITKSGRLAALTNYRALQNIGPNAASRGRFTSDFLTRKDTPEQYIRKIKNSGIHYNGFNLMVGNSDSLFYYNNVNHNIKEIDPGTYGLSNGFFQENWPKIKKGRTALKAIIKQPEISANDLLNILNNNAITEDKYLPKTGIPVDKERLLSPLFIKMKGYGTRCSTLIFTDYQDKIKFIEKTYAVGEQKESIVNFEV